MRTSDSKGQPLKLDDVLRLYREEVLELTDTTAALIMFVRREIFDRDMKWDALVKAERLAFSQRLAEAQREIEYLHLCIARRKSPDAD